MQTSTARSSYSLHHFFTCGKGMFSRRLRRGIQNGFAKLWVEKACFAMAKELLQRKSRKCGLFDDWLSTLAWLFSRRLRWLRRRIQHGYIITQRKTGCLRLRLFYCFGFRLCKSARSAGDIGVSSVYIDWVLSCEYSPADYADHADECSKLHYFAEKDRLGMVVRLLRL